MIRQTIIQNLQTSIALRQQILADISLQQKIEQVSLCLVNCYKNDGKVLFCGNGGSAADAQHLAAELSGKYYLNRPPLFAEALHVNTSFLTAVANDYSYEEIYARLVCGMGRPGDVLIGLSTSGNSKNVLAAFVKANELGLTTIAFTGQGGGELKKYTQVLIEIPSTDTPRIQECHMLLGHTICEIVERMLFSC